MLVVECLAFEGVQVSVIIAVILCEEPHLIDVCHEVFVEFRCCCVSDGDDVDGDEVLEGGSAEFEGAFSAALNEGGE